MTNLLSILLQSDPGGLGAFLPLLLVLVVMYFFFFRPQIKKQKDERNFQNDISKGMRIVTNSGIHGKILELKDDYIIIESENSRLKIDKSVISKELSNRYQAGAADKSKEEKK